MTDWQPLQETIKNLSSDFFKRDVERILPLDEMNQLSNAGLGRLPLVPEFDYTDFFGVIMELAAADSNIAHAWRNHFAFVDRYFVRGGGGPSLNWIKTEIENGKRIGVANTELGLFNHGPDTRTQLSLADDGTLSVSGRKFYSTGCLYADYLLVKVKDNRDGITKNVLIPSERSGVVCHDDWDGFGQRLSASGTLDLHEVQVYPHEVLEASATEHSVYYGGSFAQLYLTAIVAGLMQRIEAEALDLLSTRKNTLYYLETEPKDDPVYLCTLGKLSSQAYCARTLILDAARILGRASKDKTYTSAEAGALCASQVKVVIDQAGLSAATSFFDLLGASSTLRTKGYDAFWRNIRTLSSHNPVNQKAVKVAEFLVSGSKLPEHGYF